jgi:hypothetical protein
MKILFFVYFGTHNNKIPTIYKKTSVFVLLLLAKQQQQNGFSEPRCLVIEQKNVCSGICTRNVTERNEKFV